MIANAETTVPAKTDARKQFEKKAFPFLCVFLNDESKFLTQSEIAAATQWLSPSERQNILNDLVSDGWLWRSEEEGNESDTCYGLFDPVLRGGSLYYAYFIGKHFPAGVRVSELVGCGEIESDSEALLVLRQLVEEGFGHADDDPKLYRPNAQPAKDSVLSRPTPWRNSEGIYQDADGVVFDLAQGVLIFEEDDA